MERASRNGSTAVDISVTHPSFNPVLCFCVAYLLHSKTRKQFFFNPINILTSFTTHCSTSNNYKIAGATGAVPKRNTLSRGSGIMHRSSCSRGSNARSIHSRESARKERRCSSRGSGIIPRSSRSRGSTKREKDCVALRAKLLRRYFAGTLVRKFKQVLRRMPAGFRYLNVFGGRMVAQPNDEIIHENNNENEESFMEEERARDNKRCRIQPCHIQMAVRNDEELNNLFGQSKCHHISACAIPKFAVLYKNGRDGIFNQCCTMQKNIFCSFSSGFYQDETHATNCKVCSSVNTTSACEILPGTASTTPTKVSPSLFPFENIKSATNNSILTEVETYERITLVFCTCKVILLFVCCLTL